MQAGDGRTSFLGNYLLAREKLDPMIQGFVENVQKISRRTQLEAYDGCAALRLVSDELTGRYHHWREGCGKAPILSPQSSVLSPQSSVLRIPDGSLKGRKEFSMAGRRGTRIRHRIVGT